MVHRPYAESLARFITTPACGLFHVVNEGSCSRFEFARAIVSDSVEVQPITTAEAARPAPRPANSALVSIRWVSAGQFGPAPEALIGVKAPI